MGSAGTDVSWSKPFGNSAASNLLPTNLLSAGTDVSWNKPFGNSAASNLVGGQGGISSMLNGVSWTNPMGTDSTGAKINGHSYKSTPQVSEPATPNTPTVNNAFGQGFGPTYLNNSVEQNFKDAYLKSLSPNTNFNINAQSNPFKANTMPTTPGLGSNSVTAPGGR